MRLIESGLTEYKRKSPTSVPGDDFIVALEISFSFSYFPSFPSVDVVNEQRAQDNVVVALLTCQV